MNINELFWFYDIVASGWVIGLGVAAVAMWISDRRLERQDRTRSMAAWEKTLAEAPPFDPKWYFGPSDEAQP